jgi:hypothetical protein
MPVHNFSGLSSRLLNLQKRKAGEKMKSISMSSIPPMPMFYLLGMPIFRVDGGSRGRISRYSFMF